MTDTLNSIAHCLQASTDAPETPTFEAWAQQWFDTAHKVSSPMELAIRSAYASDRVAWAFASAYQCALRALVPGLPSGRLLTLCVTEHTGNRPRDIQTRIDPLPDGRWRVNGTKRWAMVGQAPTTLLVVGATENLSRENLPHLRVIQVANTATGLSLQQVHATGFIPEVPHCAVELKDVVLPPDALLQGDGYLDYMKPFRTLEDVYVAAATLAYLLRVARAQVWPKDYLERVAAVLVTVHTIALQPPLDAVTHVLLAGALQTVQALRIEANLHWANSADPGAERWKRDAALFDVADAARSARRVRAWEQLTQK